MNGESPSELFLGSLSTPEDIKKLIQTPWDRLVELLLLLRKPQFIPDPVPFARILEAVVIYQLAGVISDLGRREAVQKAAREEVMRFLKV